MTIPRKASRRIMVDAVPYRWAVRPRLSAPETPLSFAVELEDAGGTTLVVTTDAVRPHSWFGPPGAVMTPAIVERVIREALQQGWRPLEKGSPFLFSLSI